MKKILQLICAAGLLGTAGCVFWDGHDHADDQDRRSPMAPVAPDYHSSGVDHSEFPGDMDHDPNR